MYPPSNLSSLNSPPEGSIFSSQYLNPDYLFEWLVKFLKAVFQKENLADLNTLLIFLSIFFVTLICYCGVRLFEIRKKEHHHLQMELAEYAHHQAEREQKKKENASVSHNERWQKVLKDLFSGSEADWKLSVIEADSMLDALLTQLGFKGESLGDKLKATTPENFQSIAVAWEVHTIRNRIAHEGSAFLLSQHEAKRVIALYESIFRQYGYI